MANTDTSESVISGVLYEKELQEAIASNLEQLQLGPLELIGKEYPVEFGRIDILAQDATGTFFVIELKREQAGRDAIAQLQSYMGAIKLSNPTAEVRGILVASSLDPSGKAAIAITSNITFCQLLVRFDLMHHTSKRNSISSEKSVSLGKSEEEKVRTWQLRGGRITHYSAYCQKCGARKTKVVLQHDSYCYECGERLK